MKYGELLLIRLVFERTQSIDFASVVENSMPETLKEMLEVLQKIDVLDDYLPKALAEIPIRTDDTEWIEAALADGREAALKDWDKRSLISWACEYHRPRSLALLVKMWPALARMKRSRWHDDGTMLHTLANEADEERPDDFEACLKILLDIGLDPLEEDRDGFSPAKLLITGKKKKCFSVWERVAMSGIKQGTKKGKGGKGFLGKTTV